jgi:xanthine dehydrogenase accessory factor
MTLRMLVRGGGDLASGVVLRCHRAGWQVCVTELANPLAVRRTVSFSQAIFDGKITIEGIHAVKADGLEQVAIALAAGEVPVMVDPLCEILTSFAPDVLVDARMAKNATDPFLGTPEFVIGLGPGFIAGTNCHAVVETLRGHSLGRVIWNGAAAPDTGIPDRMGAIDADRVLRAPTDGHLRALAAIGDHLDIGQAVADIATVKVVSPISGVLRGLIQDGIAVRMGMKIGDVDPRDDPRLCWMVSDKALAVGGGVLEAILSRPALRGKLYGN